MSETMASYTKCSPKTYGKLRFAEHETGTNVAALRSLNISKIMAEVTLVNNLYSAAS